jgi:uncharacterized membrane protein
MMQRPGRGDRPRTATGYLRPLTRPWLVAVIGVLLASVCTIAVPFVFHIAGLPGGGLAAIGFIAFFICYFTLWGDIVGRLAWRLEATPTPKPRQETILMFAHVAISAVSIAAMFLLIGTGGHG